MTGIDPSAHALAVLFVCQHDFGGPTEKQALGFAQGLIRRGHRVGFSLGVSTGDPGATGALLMERMTLLSHRFEGPRVHGADLGQAKAFSPAVIHSLNPRLPTVAAARAYSAATGAPLFVHFEDDDWRFGARLRGEPLKTRIGQVVRRVLATWRPEQWPHATRATLRQVAGQARGLDALTPALAEEVERRTGRPCSVVLPITPELAPEAETTHELPNAIARLPLALFSGTLYPVYLDDVLIGLRAVAEVQRRGYELAYVHPGRVHERIDAPRLAREAGVAEGTAIFLGQLPFRAIPPLLRRATVLLQPGAPTEFNRLRLPSKMQAYLASGTPTVTFAVGFGELLEDRREVLKTYSADPAELADRIVEVLEDEALRARLAVGGPAAARRLFDPAQNTRALESHYLAALGR